MSTFRLIARLFEQTSGPAATARYRFPINLARYQTPGPTTEPAVIFQLIFNAPNSAHFNSVYSSELRRSHTRAARPEITSARQPNAIAIYKLAQPIDRD